MIESYLKHILLFIKIWKEVQILFWLLEKRIMTWLLI